MSGQSPLPSVPLELPLLPLRDVVVFPHMVIPLFVGRPKSIHAVEIARAADELVFVVAQKDSLAEGIDDENLYEFGTVCRIVQVVNHENDDNCIKVLIEGLYRARLTEIDDQDLYMLAETVPAPIEISLSKADQDEKRVGLQTLFAQYAEAKLRNSRELVNAAESFVMQEGFGKDAAAMLGSANLLTQSPASQGLDFDAPQEPFGDTGETLSPLVAFLTHAALEAGDNMAQAGQDAIQLMTVHSSKGLEFDCVFITGMEEGLFPHENSMSDREGLEEERRLMYVAITRARKRLYLSHSQTRMLHGQTRYNLKSRFFEELPESALKWITPKNPGFGAGFAPVSGAGYAGQTGARGTFGTNYEKYAAPAPVPVQKTAPSHGIRAGMKVFHAKFGEGTVQNLEGTGDDARAQINFPRHGVKWLALSVAKLTLLP